MENKTTLQKYMFSECNKLYKNVDYLVGFKIFRKFLSMWFSKKQITQKHLSLLIDHFIQNQALQKLVV